MTDGTRPGAYGAGDAADAPVPPGWSPVQPPPVLPSQAAPAPGVGWAPPAPKPGIIPLRPLGVGELLDGAISTLRSHPRPVLGLSALVALLSQLVEVPLTWLLLGDAVEVGAAAGARAADAAGTLAATWPAAAVSLVVTLVATTFLTGVLTVVVSRAVLGESVGADAAWAVARPRLPALAAVTLVSLLVVVGALAAAAVPALAVLAAGGPGAGALAAAAAGGTAGVVAGTWLYVRLALAAPVVLLERRPALAALRRSAELVRGAWWRTFGILALVMVIASVLAGILAVPFSVLALRVGGTASTGLAPLAVSSVGTVVAAAVTWPFSAAATVLLYVDRRMRREGLDLELARAAAGAARPG